MIVDELVRCGITDAVLCPGSRSAPLAFALHAADAAGRLRLHVRIDERTAGFLALGLALRSGRPVPVVTTSGTAVANLHPAVLEASHAGVPLLVLTADRPPQLIGTGANQTVVQPGIFGDAVRLALTAAEPPTRSGRTGRGARPSGARWPQRSARPRPGARQRAVRRTAGARRGSGSGGGRRGGEPWTAVARRRVQAAPLPLDPGGADAGDRRRACAVRVREWGLPVVAEPASGVWDAGLRAGPWLLGALPDELRPAQVVVAGRPTLHRPVQRLLADPQVAVYALADPDGRSWPDVAGTVRAVGAAAPSWARRGTGRRAGSTPTPPRPRRSTRRWTPRKRPAACGWPGAGRRAARRRAARRRLVEPDP